MKRKIRIWLRNHITLKLVGTDYGFSQRFFGKPRKWFRNPFYIFCLDCGSRLLYRRIIKRDWRYTACPSCEGFMHHMIYGTPRAKEMGY